MLIQDLQYQNLGSCTPDTKNRPFRQLADEGSLLYSGGIPSCKNSDPE
jgi:hypothetical protein